MLGILVVFVAIISIFSILNKESKAPQILASETKKENYWFLLHRKSNVEYLYKGQPNDIKNSILIKTFQVKVGVPNQKPTPLPSLLGREYWKIIDKFETKDNIETAPYFLEFDVPNFDIDPFGPTPYMECNGQCHWEVPGPFGLHGIAGDPEKISKENPGSSGCIRHLDEDITYLYNLLDPKKEEIRYYIQDI